MKKDKGFIRDSEQDHAFAFLKDKLCNASLLRLCNFDLTFEVECDASRIGIGIILMQKKWLVAYFSEKLNSTPLSCSTYELYALLRALKTR